MLFYFFIFFLEKCPSHFFYDVERSANDCQKCSVMKEHPHGIEIFPVFFSREVCAPFGGRSCQLNTGFQSAFAGACTEVQSKATRGLPSNLVLCVLRGLNPPVSPRASAGMPKGRLAPRGSSTSRCRTATRPTSTRSSTIGPASPPVWGPPRRLLPPSARDLWHWMRHCEPLRMETKKTGQMYLLIWSKV